MDLLLKGRGANTGARAPLWLVRLCGAVLGYAMLVLADRLGWSDVVGMRPLYERLLFMIVGALLAPLSWGAWLWSATGALVAINMLVAFTPIVRAPALHFVRSDTDSAHVDAIVVLSGAMNEDGQLKGPVLDRLLSGLAAARRQHVTAIALSVIEDRKGGRQVFSETDQRDLMALLAPDLTVQFVHDVASTHDEAIKFAALATKNGWHRVALVTSPLHTRRACRTFEMVGLPVQCIAAVSRDYALTRLGSANDRLAAFRDVVYESAATVAYRYHGWN